MRKLLCFMIALVACCMLATMASATEVEEATVPTTCAAGCENPVWEPLPSGNTWRTLPAGHYHYYLTANNTQYRYTPNPTGTISSTNSGEKVTICLDLNGYNINTDGRSLIVYSGCVLNLMDSSEAQTGFVKGRSGSNNLVGGTIDVRGTFNLYSGTMIYEDDGTGNNPCYAGGVMSVFRNCTFNMYGGRLVGGSLRLNSGKNCNGGTIYIYDTGKVNIMAGEVISGSTPTGYSGPCIFGSDASEVTIGGDAKIDNIYLSGSKSKLNISGTFSGKARFTAGSGITPSNGKVIGSATNTPSITGDLFCTNGNGWLVNVDGSNVKLATFTPSGTRHYCENCKDVVKWTAMTSSNYTTPKNTPGDYHYYLAANQTKTYVQLCKGANVCLDLYGKNISITGRALLPNSGSQLNLMDTVGGGYVESKDGTNNPRGGTITVSGGSTFNFYSGTMKYVDGGSSTTTNGGVVAIGGVMNMYGGTILGADLPKPSSGSIYGAAFRLYNATAVFNIYGGTITAGTLPGGKGYGACGYVNDGATVTLGGNATVDNIRFAANNSKLFVEGTYTGTASVTFPSSLSIGTQVGVSKDAVLDGGKIICSNNGLLVTPQDGKLVLSVNATAVIVTESGRTNYDTLQAAIDAYESGYIQLIRTTDEAVTIAKDVQLELDGKTLAGTITVADGCTLSISDAQTDDYTVADGIYGQLTATGKVEAAEGYLLVNEDGKLSAHKVDLAIHTMSLRPDVAGIYYKSTFLGDEKVAAQVETFGVALSVIDVPYEKNLNTKCVSSEFTTFQSGAAGNAGASTLLKGILKETNTEKINGRNLAMEIYGRPYIKTAAGYIFGEPVSRNLHQQLEAADALTEGLNASQWYGLEDFCEAYAAVLTNINMPNILAGLQDDTLSLLMVGNSFCYYYVEELYGLLMANPDPNRGYDKVEIVNVYYSGCSLSSHYKWWANDEAHYQVFRTNANGRKELTPPTGSAWRLEDALQLGRWDFISLQGASSENNYSGATTEENVTKMIPLAEPLLARFHELHAEAQLLWHRTWAFEVGRKSGSTTYTEDLLARYDAGMQAVCDWMCEEFDKDKPYDLQIVNSGVAWRLAREANALLETPLIPAEGGLCARLGVRNETTYPYYTGNNNTGDGYHDGDIGGAQFLNACVWYEKLTGQSVLDNPYKPTTTKGEFEVSGKYTLSDEFADLLRTAAHGVNEIED